MDDSLSGTSFLNRDNLQYLEWMCEEYQKNKNIGSSQNEVKLKVKSLIVNYKKYGHLKSSIDPLGLAQRENPKELSPEYNELSQDDLKEVIEITNYGKLKVSEIIERLEKMYCSSI
jgi:2-oxoglutarate dehydrogenase complex dehydrogenase (E1) component-like enzyme